MKRLIEKILSFFFPPVYEDFIGEVHHKDENKVWFDQRHPEVRRHGRTIKHSIF